MELSPCAALPRLGAPPLWRSLPALWRDPLGFLESLAREQGDFAQVRLGWVRLFLLNHPDLVKEALVTKQASFEKGHPLKKARFQLGRGLLTSEGEFHRRQRGLIQPAFHRQRIAAYAGVLAHCAEEMQQRWQDGEELDASVEMMRLSQRAVVRALFDADVEEEEGRQAGRALDALVQGFGLILLPLSGLLLRLPLPAVRRLRRAQAELDRLIFRWIRERRENGDRGDVLSMLLFAEDEEGGGGMSEQQVRDEAMTLFLAGHDTTGNSLAWTWYLLSRHPGVEARWYRELDETLGDRLPTAEDLGRLRYTRQIFQESLRLFPPVPAVGRRAVEAVEIGGRTIPRGSVVEVCPWLLHRDPRFFPEPERFAPERWTEELEQRLPKGAYFPFGMGPRLCIGMHLAAMAGVVLLATLGRRWRMRSVSQRPVAILPRCITLRPQGGLRMRLERRCRPAGRRAPEEVVDGSISTKGEDRGIPL